MGSKVSKIEQIEFIPSETIPCKETEIEIKETPTETKHVSFDESVEYHPICSIPTKGIKIVPKKKGIKIVPKPKQYRPEEINNMDNTTLAQEFIRLTGHKTLYCKHCKGEKPIEVFWINSIRKRCMKKGLSKDMELPKTCDKQQAKNTKCNVINNPIYQKLRNQTITKKEQDSLIQQRIKKMRKIGIEPNPHKYIL